MPQTPLAGEVTLPGRVRVGERAAPPPPPTPGRAPEVQPVAPPPPATKEAPIPASLPGKEAKAAPDAREAPKGETSFAELTLAVCPICKEGKISKVTASQSYLPGVFEFVCDSCGTVIAPSYAFLGLVRVADEFMYKRLPSGYSRASSRFVGRMMSGTEIIKTADQILPDAHAGPVKTEEAKGRSVASPIREERHPHAPEEEDTLSPAGITIKRSERREEGSAAAELKTARPTSQDLRTEIDRLYAEKKMVDTEIAQIQVEYEIKELAASRDPAARTKRQARLEERDRRLRPLLASKEALEEELLHKRRDLSVLEREDKDSDAAGST
jgi:hypothetical protein